MDLITIAVLLVVGIALVAYAAWPRDGSKDTVKRRLEGRKAVVERDDISERARVKASEKLARKAAPMLSRLVMPVSDDEVTQLRFQLIQAGYRQQNAQTIFLGLKTACLALFAVVGVGVGLGMGYGTGGIAACLMFGGGLGFVAPGMWLSRAIRSRQDKVRRSLPDVLDMLVVSVESGLALDAGIKRVGEEMAIVHPEISEELRIAVAEGQMGIPRSEALNNMANRAGIDELRSLVSVIAQAERFGTSVGKALRNQSDTVRTKRRQEAEERAQKTAVKLMIPLVLFIFPAMGIVLAGPAGIQLMEAFAE